VPPKYGSCLWANVPRIGIDIEAHTHYATLLHSAWLLPLFKVWVGRAQLGWRERGYGAAEIRQLLVGKCTTYRYRYRSTHTLRYIATFLLASSPFPGMGRPRAARLARAWVRCRRNTAAACGRATPRARPARASYKRSIRSPTSRGPVRYRGGGVS